jgi:hypothetical protein
MACSRNRVFQRLASRRNVRQVVAYRHHLRLRVGLLANGFEQNSGEMG